MRNALAVDMGGSKYIVGILREDGEILASRKYSWDDLSPEGVLRAVITASKKLLAEYPQYPCSLAGATIPGLADPEKGIWVESSFSGIRDIPFAALFEQQTGFKTYIDNDSNACTVAEKMYGHAKELSDFVYFTVSNGCGGALFANNRRYFGGLGNAGEIGHCVVKEGGRLCKCGSRGCLEIEAAGRAIPLNFTELGGPEQIGGEPANAKSIDALARAGDPIAIKTYELEGYYLGKVAAQVANIFNPQLIIIGGGVSMGFDLFEKSLVETLESQIYKNANRGLRVLQTALGYEGALVGAGALAFNGESGLY